MQVCKLLVQCLENEGVEYLFGLPGEENLDLLRQLQDSKIQLILTRHEQAAGFMAAAYARLTGKVGVALATLGPGATNLLTSSSYALLAGMPVLFITGQKPVKKNKQGRFQVVNIVEMMRPVTKMARQIVNGNNIPSLVREGFRLALQEKPGPVHLELPEDIAREDIEGIPFPITTFPHFEACREDIQRATCAIEKAHHPLILIASGASRDPDAGRAVQQLMEKTGIFFFCTQMGKGVIDERHSKYLGTAALSDHDYLHCAIDCSDLIINIGHDVVEKPPFIMEHGGKTVIHICLFPAQIDAVYFPQVEVVGDLSHTLKEITANITPSSDWDFTYFEKTKNQIDSHVRDKDDDKNFPLLPQRVVADVRRAVSSEGILALDNGMYKIWFARNYLAHLPNTLLLDNALATMGAGLPVAIAAKIVHPKKEVVAVCGDGGFMMNSQEIETAVRLKIDLVVLILRDDAYGMIKWKQASMDMPSFGLDFGNPDFAQYAQSYGAKGHKVSRTGKLTPLLKKCLQSKGVHLIEVPIDYSENEKVLLEELKKKTCLI